MKDEPEVCLIAEFFKKEAEKPVGQRATTCLIYCSCKKCRKIIW